MTFIHLVCPQCRNQGAYDDDRLDTSTEIACSAFGFSGLPTSFELPKGDKKTSWQGWKIAIIILAGIAFIFVGYYVLSVLVLSAFFVLVIIAAVVVILWYQKRKEKKAT